jgi:acyl dehydratase
MDKQDRRYLSNDEIDKALIDKNIRDRMKVEMEENMEKGKPRPCTIGAPLYGLDIRNRVATEDAIRHYCDGLGDFNPLYRNREYAKNTVYGGIIAPPSFINAIVWLTGLGHDASYKLDYFTAAIEAGCRIEWFKVIREGDSFTAFEIPTEVIDSTREGPSGHLQFLVRANRVYKNQENEVICIVNGSLMMIVPRPPIKEGEPPQPAVKLREFKPYHFSVDEIEDWYQKTINEEIRGATPRFWEDVNIGDELPPVHHIYTPAEFIAFAAGSGFSASNWVCRMRQIKNGKEMFGWKQVLDKDSGFPDLTIQHVSDMAAKRLGFATRAIAAGVQLKCWLTHVVTNWVGDTGFLKKMEDQVRKPLYRESLVLCKGRVVKKYIEDGQHLVDLHVTLEDHWGDLIIPNGLATVVLPSRQMENWRPAKSSANSWTPF